MSKNIFIDYVFSLGAQIPFLCVCAKLLRLCPTLCDPMDYSLPGSSVRLSKQEYLSGLPCPPPGDLPEPGTETLSLTSPALARRFFTSSATWEAHSSCNCV